MFRKSIGIDIFRWFNSRPRHFGLSLGKTVYSMLPQSTHLQIGYLASIWQCSEPVCCATFCQLLWNIPRGIEMVSVCIGLLGKEGRVNIAVDTRLIRIPLPLPLNNWDLVLSTFRLIGTKSNQSLVRMLDHKGFCKLQRSYSVKCILKRSSVLQQMRQTHLLQCNNNNWYLT